jgi:hypothetical protein
MLVLDDLKPEKPSHIVTESTLGHKRPASRELSRDPKRKRLIDELPTVTPSSATHKKVHAEFGERIEYNCPKRKLKTIPIALLDEIFGVFRKDCEGYKPTHEDNRFLANLRAAMFEEYKDEATRAAAFRDVFEEYGLKLESNKVKIWHSQQMGPLARTVTSISFRSGTTSVRIQNCRLLCTTSSP